MFLIRKLVDSTRKCYPIFPSQYLLVDIIVSSLKLVFRVNKEKKPFLFFQPCIESNSYVYNFSKARGLLFQDVEGCVHSGHLGFSGHRTCGKDDKQLIGSHCWDSAGIQQNCISLVLRTCVLDDIAFPFGSSLPTALEWVIEPCYVGIYEDPQMSTSVNWDYGRFHYSKSESSGIFISLLLQFITSKSSLKLAQDSRNNIPGFFKRDCRQDSTNVTHPQEWNLTRRSLLNCKRPDYQKNKTDKQIQTCKWL